MRKKRIYKLLLLGAFVMLLAGEAWSLAAEATPSVSSASAVLMEQESGQVLYSREADTPLPIASITKIMTALLAVERCAPEEEITIRPEWLRVEGSSMGLQAGESRSAEELLYGLMLASGNDAAIALACHMAGDMETFADWMNARAAELGMEHTHFLNPHGLSQEGHYSTARDMGILTCAAMSEPRFAEIVGSRTAEIGGRTLRNHNKLLWSYPGTLGVKTGFTEAAGRTLVSCARREGMTLVCVTLNDPADWKDHTALLDWGFSAFTREQTDARSWRLPMISGAADTVLAGVLESKGVLIPSEAQREWRITLPSFLYAPCNRGEELGRAELYVDGSLLCSCPISALETVPLDETVRLGFWERLRSIWYDACRAGYSPGLQPY